MFFQNKTVERILSNVAGGGQPVVDIGTELPTIKGGNPIDLAGRYMEYVRRYFNETANQKTYCENNGIIYDSEIDIFSMQELFKKALSGYAPDKLYYFNANHLGSGSLITDEHGQTYQTLIYAPHGEVLLNKFYGDYDEVYKFTGYEKDNESGLDYAKARYQDPNIGFNSTDAKWYLSPHQSSYTYAGNNPVNRIDPDGNTDYINESGKVVYNDGVDNGKYRTLSNKDWTAIRAQFGSAYKSGMKKPLEFWSTLEDKSKEITFENAGADFAAMWNSSKNESAGLFLFNFNEAKVSFEQIPVENATPTGAYQPYKAGDTYHGSIVLGNAHTHPTEHTYLGKMSTKGIVTDAMNFGNQYTIGRDGAVGDGLRAVWQGANYTIGKYNVDYFSPQGRAASINNLTTRSKLENNKGINIVKHAFQQYVQRR